jgi:hypothetical protein
VENVEIVTLVKMFMVFAFVISYSLVGSTTSQSRNPPRTMEILLAEEMSLPVLFDSGL